MLHESEDEASGNWQLMEEEHPNGDDLIDGDETEEREEMAREAPAQPTDFTLLDLQPELLDTEKLQWLAHQDEASDNLVYDLLTSDGATDDFDWTCDPTAFRGTRELFTGTPGPTFPVTTSTRPTDVFLRFFNNELVDLLVRETNSYATTLIKKTSMAPKSRLRAWKDTDRAEMCVFLSVLMFQGLLPRPTEKDYWSENGYLTLAYFKQLMTYSRFLLMKRMLHFADNGDVRRARNYDDRKLRQIWPVLKLLNKKFSALYRPGRDVTINESLLKWQGRLGFAQNIATKAANVGVKGYELCESVTGYLWKFFVHTSKSETEQTDLDRQTNGQTDRPVATTAPPPPPDSTARIVYDLANPLFNLGHTIVMDNFYNSPLLARYLKSHGTDCFGTLRINREFVPESLKSVTKSEMIVGEVVQSFCRDLHVMMWRDTNVVAMISTFHKGEVGGKVKHGHHSFKPQVVLDYNLTMGGVEKKDQLLSPYPIERVRNQVWYKKVFRRILNVTILNSYIIYRTANKISHLKFRTRLAEELVQTFLPPPVERPISTVKTKSMVPGHGSVRRPLIDGNHFVGEGRSKFSRCVHCHKSRTKYSCKQCNVSLCLLTCFELFHTSRTDN